MMLRAYELTFSEPKRLPSEGMLLCLGIVYVVHLQQFKNSDDPTMEGYPLKDFINDYYKMDLDSFRQKLEDLIESVLGSQGYIVYHGEKLPIRES